MESTNSFDQMMDSLAKGDSAAAERVFERYVERLRNLARQRLEKQFQGKFDADDVIQSVFRSFFRRQRSGSFKLTSSDELWALLARITVRKCGRTQQALRRQKRDARREKPLRGHSFQGGSWDAVSREPSPEEIASLTELVQQVMHALDDQQRRLVQLKLQGHTNEEISREVGRTERTVYRVLKDVRQKLNELESQIQE